MVLQAPKLDDRNFQDLVNETKRMIPRYCPEWTDHNVSDPGVTFIELFAYMTDILLYRINRVPQRNYIKWLDMLGIHLKPPRAARAEITFYLTGPQPDPVVLFAGTQVATVRAELQEAIPFSTDVDLTIYVPTLFQLLVSRDGSTYHDYLPTLSNPALNVGIFQDPPQPNDAMYFGYHEELKGHILRLALDSQIEGIGVNPKDPPLAWEYWDGPAQEWLPVQVEADTTGGLNRPGEVILQVPFGAQARDIDGKVAFWLRCRATAPRPEQRAYSAAPRIRGVATESLGGIVSASQVETIENEPLDRSTGRPNQEFQLSHRPILARQSDETLEVEDEMGDFVPWTEVIDFGSSKPDDLHYTLDSISGIIRFGPRIRDANGLERQFGVIPPEGRRLQFTRYRIGGGARGNVGKNTITVLKSSVPFVAAVTNSGSSTGGEDPESLEMAMQRGPQTLRARSRAVTTEDYEYLAREASSEVKRVRCQAPSTQDIAAGRPVIQLFLVPDSPYIDTLIPWQELFPNEQARKKIAAYLDERRLITAQVELKPPVYRFVAVEATVVARKRAPKHELQAAIERALYRFINPVHGGPENTGWPWERDLFQSEITAMMHQVEGVEHVESIQFFTVDMLTNTRTPMEGSVPCPVNGLLASALHKVTIK